MSKGNKLTVFRLLKIIMIAIILLVVLLIGSIEIYLNFVYDPDTLKAKVVEFLNDKIEGEVTLADVDITLFERLSHASIVVDSLIVHEEKDTVLILGEVFADISLKNILQAQLNITKFTLSDVYFKAHVNLDTTKTSLRFKKPDNKPRPKRKSESILNIESHDIEIKNAYLDIANKIKENGVKIRIKKGLFRLDIGDTLISVAGNTTAHLVAALDQNEPLIENYDFEVHDVLLFVDKHKQEIIIDHGDATIADMDVKVRGKVLHTDTVDNVDVHVIGNDANLNAVLSAVPEKMRLNLIQKNENAVISIDFRKVGYSNRILKPRTDIKFLISKAAIQNGENGQLLDSIHIAGLFTNGEKRNGESSKLDLESVHAILGRSFIDLSLHVENLTDPAFRSKINGSIDVGDVQSFIPDFTRNGYVDGIVDIEIDVEGKLSDMKAKRYMEEKFKGKVKFTDMSYRSETGDNRFAHVNGAIKLDNHIIKVENFKGEFNEEKFSLDGQLEEYVNVLLKDHDGDMTTNFTMAINRLEIPKSEKKKDQNGIPELPDKLISHFDVNIDTLDLGDQEIVNLVTSFDYRHNNLDINKFSAKFNNGDIKLNGKISRENAFEFGGKLVVDADLAKIDFNEMLKEPDTTAIVENEKMNLRLPELHVMLEVDSILYDSLVIKVNKADVRYKDSVMLVTSLNMDSNIGHIRNTRPVIVDLNKEIFDGGFQIELDDFHADIFEDENKTSKAKEPSTMDMASWLNNSRLSLDFKANNLYYQKNKFDRSEVKIDLNNKVLFAQFDIDGYEGNLKGSGNTFITDTTMTSHYNVFIDDAHLKKLLGQNNNFSQELLTDEKVNGQIDLITNLKMVYDFRVDSVTSTDGILIVDDLGIDLIKFDPLTSALVFIKHKNKDTISVIAQDVKIYYSKDEIVISPFLLKTTQSNFHFFGYHDKKDYLEFAMELSISDLVLKRNKKKIEDFNNAEKNTLGGILFRIDMAGEMGNLKTRHIRNKIYHQKRDSILNLEKNLQTNLTLSAF